MKTLLILRHAKAEAARERQADHDRALTSRGLHDAVRIGEHLVENELIPDLIFTSTAVRARQTAELVAATCDLRGCVQLCDELYMGPPGAYLERVRQATDGQRRVLMVGHNPILEHLVESLTGRDVTLATATLAVVQADVKHWRDMVLGENYTLADLVHPHER